MTPNLFEEHSWMMKYSKVIEATVRYRTSKKENKTIALTEVLETMKELLLGKETYFKSSKVMRYKLDEVKEIIDEHKEGKFANQELAEVVSEIYYYYAILQDKMNEPNRILPLLLEVEEFLTNIYSKEKMLIYVLPRTVLRIATKYGGTEGIDPKEYYDKANDYFNKVEGINENSLVEKIRYYHSYSKLLKQQKKEDKSIIIIGKMVEAIDELTKIVSSDNTSLNVAYHVAAKELTKIKRYDKAGLYFRKVLKHVERTIFDFLPKEQEVDMSMMMGAASMSYSPSEAGTRSFIEKEKRMFEQAKRLEFRRVEADPRCKFISISLEYAKNLIANNQLISANSFLLEVAEKYFSISTKYIAFLPTLALYNMIWGFVRFELESRKEALESLEIGWKLFKASRDYNKNQLDVLNRVGFLAYVLFSEGKENEALYVMNEALDFSGEIDNPELFLAREISYNFNEILGTIIIMKYNQETNDVEDSFNLMTKGLYILEQLTEIYQPEIIPEQKKLLEIFFKLSKEMCKKTTGSKICEKLEKMKESVFEKIG
ncbi:MAG: hypothetical protein ACTSQ4_11370 [Candidatus Heimdallarchaeaceae archaeon]